MIKRKTYGIRAKKVPKDTLKWVKSIPRGKHGSGHLQQRLWRLTSDYCRIRDFYGIGFKGWFRKCIATNTTLENWNDGQAGHYRGFTTCNGMFKFHPMNIHLQTAQSNSWPTSQTWESFANNLRLRYGNGIIDEIDRANRNTALKITTTLVMDDIERKIEMIKKLPEQPKYFSRLIKLKESLTPLQ